MDIKNKINYEIAILSRDILYVEKIKCIRARTVLRLFKLNLSVGTGKEFKQINAGPGSRLFYLLNYPFTFLWPGDKLVEAVNSFVVIHNFRSWALSTCNYTYVSFSFNSISAEWMFLLMFTHRELG